ncbi:MAG TPA: ATP-binding cassette domain-containing protein [Acidimicrobiia bacterium]|nr:ATP-binding cassette domain-containing protein [Acidimicrobiia bacterium]
MNVSELFNDDLTFYLQVLVTGLGAGAAYALFAQGVVLIYRGSGIVNFAQGALGMLAAYITFFELRTTHQVPIGLAVAIGIGSSVVVVLLFQVLVLRLLSTAAPIVRLISTLGLLVVVQSAVVLRYGDSNVPVEPYLPHDVFRWGDVVVQEYVLYVIGITLVVTFALWAFVRYSRIGLAISAAAQNEQAVQTMGWSPNKLSALTWGLGAGLAGLAGVLIAPLTGLSTITFTLVVVVTAMAAALLGGFRSFPLTLVGGLLIGFGEAWVVRKQIAIQDFFGVNTLTGLARAIPFLLILLVLVVRGRGLPLRSHITDRLPKLGTGQVSIPGLLIGSAVLLLLIFGVMDDTWAAATNVSIISAIVVLSIVVLTGYAGQLSLGQWALAGCGALIAGSFVLRFDMPMELAIPLGVLLTIPIGLIFALPALRTRGVNLAIVTLGLGYTISGVVFANTDWIGARFGGAFNSGTEVGRANLFGLDVDNATHPQRWAAVCLGAFVLAGLVVANLRRSRTGRRLIAVRTNERAAESLGISVFGVKLYAFSVAAGIAGLGGIMYGFHANTITYEQYSPLQSIFSVGWAVIGGLGYAIGSLASAPNAIGGLGTRFMDDALSIGNWDQVVGGLLLLLVIVLNQDGIAEVASSGLRPLFEKLHLVRRAAAGRALPDRPSEPVPAGTLVVDHLTVRFGGVTAVDDASFEVRPGEVVGLIGPNGAGKTTIIDAVTGFVKPSAGDLRLNDASIAGWSATKRARRGLRRSFQSLELFDDVSVEDNIRAGADDATTISWFTDLFWPGKHELAPTAVSAIREFDLEPHLHQVPDELPYGRRRLVGIARAVASGPSVILLDEPAAGLDETESQELARLIRRLADERQMAVLLVEHDVNLVMSTCDRIIVLNFGQVIATGTPAEVRDDPAVREAYLGGGDENLTTSTPASTTTATAADPDAAATTPGTPT